MWWWPIFDHLLDVTIQNAWLLCRTYNSITTRTTTTTTTPSLLVHLACWSIAEKYARGDLTNKQYLCCYSFVVVPCQGM